MKRFWQGSPVFAILATLLLAGCGGRAPASPPASSEPPKASLPAAESPRGQSLESYLQDNPRFEPLAIYAENQDLRRMSRPIGMLQVYFGNSRSPKQCTAILADSAELGDLILTARHCFESGKQRARSATLSMGFYDRRQSGVQSYPVDPVPVATGRRLDYALARVEGNPIRTWGSARFTDRLPETREQLLVIHHPNALPKHVTRFQCVADAQPVQGVDLRHLCDTVKGSSGAPVLSSEGNVIGLHYAGFDIGAPVRANYAVLVRDVFSEFAQDLQSPRRSRSQRDPQASVPRSTPRSRESYVVTRREPNAAQARRGVILFPEIIVREQPTRSAGLDCRIRIATPLASLKVKPDRFSVDIRNIPVAEYRVQQKKLVRTLLKQELWYRIRVRDQQGWVVGDNWSLSAREGSECL